MNKREIKKLERIEKIKKILKEVQTLVDFKYGDDRWGNMESYYYPEEDKVRYYLFFEGKGVLVDSLDEAVTVPFIDGKSLSDVTKEIRIYNGMERIY